VGSDLFSENVTLATRVTGAWRTRKGGRKKEERGDEKISKRNKTQKHTTVKGKTRKKN